MSRMWTLPPRLEIAASPPSTARTTANLILHGWKGAELFMLDVAVFASVIGPEYANVGSCSKGKMFAPPRPHADQRNVTLAW
jgi:hypothetical protein